jgi:hypothetical protein
MTRQRSRAYGRVMQILKELGPAKLLPSEQERLRHAADTFVFCADLADSPPRNALSDVRALCEHLIDSGRWTPEHAGMLLDAIWACGPSPELVLPAAA